MKKALLVAALMVSGSVMAKSYQAQGCGLGSTLFTDGSSLVHQVLGTTTNGTSFNNTFGMTSGTSNCELDKSGRAQSVFIEANKVALQNDIARGQGEALTTLSKMYGCDSATQVAPVLQKNYKSIFPSQEVSAEAIDSTISSLIRGQKACI